MTEDDMKMPVTIGGKAIRTTLPYISPPYTFAMIGDAQARRIAEEIKADPMIPIELLQLCEWVLRAAEVPKPPPAGTRVVRLGDERPSISDLELRDQARAAKGLPLLGRTDIEERDTFRDLDFDEQTIVADVELP